jgi:microcin C transport system substrate-binding protein
MFPTALRAILLASLAFSPAAAIADQNVTAHGISAFGDLKYPPDFEHFDYVNPEAPKGGTMSFRGFLASQTFDSLNPFILKGEAAQGLERLYDTLLARAYDEPDAVYGLLAESIEYPPDRSWVIYNLRPDARFSDGHPVTADDVVFTVETLQAEGSPRIQLRLKDIASATALSSNAVRIDFAEGVPTRDLISDFGQVEILPRHYYDEVPFAESTLEPPLGSGPYEVARVDAGRSITYCRDPDYWGADLPVNIGKDNFECVRYEFFADTTAAFEAFKAGEFLFQEEFSSANWATAYDFPALDKGWVKLEVLPDGRAAGAQGFWFNLRRPQFQDPRVREAIGMMFNFEWSNQTLFSGLYNRTDSFWENTSMQAEGVPEGAEAEVLDSLGHLMTPEFREALMTRPAYTPPVADPGTQVDRALLRRAGRLLTEAGWIVGEDGIRRNEAGQKLTLDFADDSPAFERIILPFIANLERLGVEATHTLLDPAQMEERQKTFEYDVIVARFSLPLSPSVELRELFGSASADQPGTFNLTGLADPLVDELVERIIGAPDRETLEVHVRALDRILRARQIWVPNWNKGEFWIAYWDVFDRPKVKPTYDRGHDYWWFDQQKHDALVAQGALR